MLLRRILLAVAALALAFVAWRDAAGAYWLEAAPAEAPARFAEADPRLALARLDPMLLFGAAGRDDALAVSRHARAALTDAPLEASAMSQLALASTLLGGRDLKNELKLAERLSRRDRVAQAALLSLAAAEGDYRATFDHLDKGLLVSPGGGQQVFPSLVPLLGDAKVRSSLLPYARREWFSGFLAAAADKAADPTAVAELMFARGPVPAKERQWLLPHMLGRLVAAGQYDMARKVAVRLAGASPASLDAFAFTAAATDPSLAPLTWKIQSDDVVRARLALDDSVDVEAMPGRAGIIAERLTRLAAGGYAVEQRIGALESGLPPRLEWLVGCKAAGGQRAILQQALTVAARETVYRGSLVVPGDCPEQLWQLKVLVEDQQTSSRFQIGSPVLNRSH